jgi:hypothetical protein
MGILYGRDESLARYVVLSIETGRQPLFENDAIDITDR